MMTLCTLFDHNYLDKGITMYKSLEEVCDGFELYVLAMSDRCYEILIDLNYPHLKPIKLVDFEDEELLRVKPFRKVGEYCWTCSSSLIRYVLMTFNPNCCTYIDADLFFYANPKVLIDEMYSSGASVQVIGHRFDKKFAKQAEHIVGKYCVEFNTFKNDERSLMLLNKWRNQCLEHCSIDGDGVYWGDQKYQERWCDEYDFVMETKNLGAGVAPWNIRQYRRHGNLLYNKQYDKTCSLVFYHFENIIYKNLHKADINISGLIRSDLPFVRKLYKSYLQRVNEEKKMLREIYGLDTLLLKHPGVEESDKRLNLFLRLKDMVNKIFRTISF